MINNSIGFENFSSIINKNNNIPSLKLKSYNKILVLSPHCDDEVIGCGGLMIRYLNMNCQMHIIYLTSNKRNKILRQNEARNAWEDFNVVQEFWDFPDGELMLNKIDASHKLKEKIDSYNPAMILLPWPLDNHRDHSVVYSIIQLASISIKCDLYFYEVFHPVMANYLINISECYYIKRNIMEAYNSQKYLNFIKSTEYLNQYRAACLGIKAIKYAEAYFVSRL